MLLPKQIWKDIPGYEGRYQVSNTGKVRSLNYRGTGKKQILKQITDRDGYKRITLWKSNKSKSYLVHRLVAQAFIPNPDNLPCINHIDEDKANNVVWNLEYCTHKYNDNYGTRNKRSSEARKGHKRTKEVRNKISTGRKGKGKPILMFSKNDDVFIRRFDCVAEANEFLGKDRYSTNIAMCARGEQESAWEYKWKYEEDCK